MTEYDPLAEAIVEAYGDVEIAFDSDIPEWKLADWQAAAKVAREFIAAEDDGWVEVSGVGQIRKGDEVLVILEDVDGLKITTSGVAHHRDRDGDWAVEQGGVLTNVYDSDQTIHVRRKKQEPPTAPFIIAYKLEGRDEYPNGIPMVRIPEGTYAGMYSSPEHITTIIWSPTHIHRYDVAKAVVDG